VLSENICALVEGRRGLGWMWLDYICVLSLALGFEWCKQAYLTILSLPLVFSTCAP